MARTWQESVGLTGDGPTGIVGPGNSIGAVMQMRMRIPPYILVFFTNFLRVGLCSLYFYLQDTWRRDTHRMKSSKLRQVNRVNSSPPDHHQGRCANGSL